MMTLIQQLKAARRKARFRRRMAIKSCVMENYYEALGEATGLTIAIELLEHKQYEPLKGSCDNRKQD